MDAYDLRVSLNLSAHVVPPEADDQIEQWRAELYWCPEEVEQLVAVAEFLVAPQGTVEPELALDAMSAEAATFAMLFDGSDLDESLDVEGFEGLVIVDRVEVVAAMQGRGLGPVLVAEALHRLGRECAIAACSDSPTTEVDDGGADSVAIRRMIRDFGFTEWRDGIWTLDLATTALTATRLAIHEARLRSAD